MFYLTIPQSHMNRAEVKSLLSESEAKKELSPVKSESTDVPVQEQEETVESSTISTTSPILDPSVVPEGQGLVDVLVTHCDSTTDFDSLRQIVTDSK